MPLTRPILCTLADVLLHATAALPEDLGVFDELRDAVSLGAERTTTPHVVGFLLDAALLGTGIAAGEAALQEAVEAALPAELRGIYSAARHGRFGAWLLRPLHDGRWMCISGRDPEQTTVMPVSHVSPAFADGQEQTGVGWLVPALEAFVGRPVREPAWKRFERDRPRDLRAWRVGALAMALAPSYEVRRSPPSRWPPSATGCRALVIALERALRCFDRPIPVGTVFAGGLSDLVALTGREARAAALEVATGRAYRRVARARWGPDPTWIRALREFLTPADLLLPFGLSPEGALTGEDDERLLRRPAALLRLPADHPIWAEHQPDQPIRLLRARARPGDGVEDAVQCYLREHRWSCTVTARAGESPMFWYRMVLAALADWFHPDACATPLAALPLDSSTRVRLLNAMFRRGPMGREPRVADLPPAAIELLALPNIAGGTLAALTEALFEHAALWRFRAAGLDAATVDHRQPSGDLHEGLTALAALFEAPGS